MNNSYSTGGILDQYRVEIGDTERSVEEVINDIKSYGEPVVQVKLAVKATGRTAAGSVLNVALAPASMDERTLKDKLNEAGGCMYQVVSVTKLP